jgi:uncharacterized protein (TIGR04255 family)
MATRIPSKLKDDSIVEAICEIRFECKELPEIVLGRLSDCNQWGKYNTKRLPVANIPEAIRIQDANLRFSPVIELLHKDGHDRIRIGGNVISLHIAGKYCGWEKYKGQLDTLFACLFEKLSHVNISRIGFRYVNALTSARHQINVVNDLKINITAGGNQLEGQVNLNYLLGYSPNHIAMTRIATTNFVDGPLLKGASVIVDIDVFTPPGIKMADVDEMKLWTKDAHKYEKIAFFSLFSDESLKNLVEEW